MVIPILSSLIFNQFIMIILTFELSTIIFLNYLHYALNHRWLFSLAQITKRHHFEKSDDSQTVRFEFVSRYRSLLQIATCISILAVDFRMFPRKFCKVEEIGISLMDCGTGSALFSLALVSRQLRENNRNIFFRVFRALSSCLPLFLIGIIRMMMIKKTDYQVFS